MRPLVQYDLDEVQSAPVPTGPNSNALRPPSKKRKRNHRNPSAPPKKVRIQHWDDPGSTAVGVAYDEEGSASVAAKSATASSYAEDVEEEEDECCGVAQGNEGADEDEDEEEEAESRPLTHEEVWDDTALIDAWNSAEAEYEAYHGTTKSWKTEAVKKSPLWYNKPYMPPASQPGPSKPGSRSKNSPPPLPQAQEDADGDAEPDTALLDFDTFVPTHDPSLTSVTDTGARPAAIAPLFVPPPPTTMVSRDEAFNNALSAMYWSGYWTAVYHSQASGKNNNGAEETTEDGIESDEDEEDLVPAQR